METFQYRTRQIDGPADFGSGLFEPGDVIRAHFDSLAATGICRHDAQKQEL
jgi:hypothetical protein